jgi:hypothetical protein
MMEMEHSLSPELTEKLLVRSALRLGITAATFDRVARDLYQLEIGFYQNWLTDFGSVSGNLVTYSEYRGNQIAALLEYES